MWLADRVDALAVDQWNRRDGLNGLPLVALPRRVCAPTDSPCEGFVGARENAVNAAIT